MYLQQLSTKKSTFEHTVLEQMLGLRAADRFVKLVLKHG